MRNSYDEQPVSFDELPDLVNAADEELYRRVLITLLEQQGLDKRFAYGNIMDEYHDVPLNEMYEDHVPLTYDESDYEKDEDDNIIVPVPKQAMIDYATYDLASYTEHEPDHHEDGDVTKPSKRTVYSPQFYKEGDYIDPDCMRCSLDEEFALEDELVAMGLDARIDLLRAYLDSFMPKELEPYEVNPSDYNVVYYHVTHDGKTIGSVQFNDRLQDIQVPLVHEAIDSGLFNAQQRHFGRPTEEEMRAK